MIGFLCISAPSFVIFRDENDQRFQHYHPRWRTGGQQPQFYGRDLVLPVIKGSTLEDTFKQEIARTPLWSAKPIQENPESIVDAHLAFLKAGAGIILTSTYVPQNKNLSYLNLEQVSVLT